MKKAKTLVAAILVIFAMSSGAAMAREVCVSPPADSKGKEKGRVPEATLDLPDDFADILVEIGAATDGPCDD